MNTSVNEYNHDSLCKIFGTSPNIYYKENVINLWNWDSISEQVTYNDFINNPELPWNYKYLSRNPNIRIENMRNNFYKRFGWYIILWFGLHMMILSIIKNYYGNIHF